MTRTVLWAGRQVSGAMTVMENFPSCLMAMIFT